MYHFTRPSSIALASYSRCNLMMVRATFCQLFGLLAGTMFSTEATLNNRPVIGILTEQIYPPKNQSYIGSSYVKFLESAGARVMPILSNSSAEQLTSMFTSINGVLFPGGGVYLNSSYYGQAGSVLYSLAKKANDEGGYFPLWGTCLGFQLLGYLAANKDMSVLTSVDALNISLPLNFSSDAKSSRLYSVFSPEEMKLLGEEPLTFNNHRKAITVETFHSRPELSGFFSMLSSNRDRQGVEFVSSMEAKKYPFYGVQWHPEKNGFEWNRRESINHSWDAVMAMQKAANFFVNEARRSDHSYSEEFELIYMYTPTYTGGKSSFEQIYFF